MENQEIDEEEVVASDLDVETNNEEQEEDEDNTSTKKNTSNFKALYKSNKEKERLLAEKEQELEQAKTELEEWRNLNPDTVEELKNKNDVASIKEELFVIKNPDAEPHINEIRKTMKSYSMDFEKAWKFVKIDLPQESKTKTDFSVGKTTVNKNTDFTKISPEDALELSKEDQSKWRKANGWE